MLLLLLLLVVAAVAAAAAAAVAPLGLLRRRRVRDLQDGQEVSLVLKQNLPLKVFFSTFFFLLNRGADLLNGWPVRRVRSPEPAATPAGP